MILYACIYPKKNIWNKFLKIVSNSIRNKIIIFQNYTKYFKLYKNLLYMILYNQLIKNQIKIYIIVFL